ncbi:plastocyanin/azurin family copper-binding protein [Natrinema versiforme]|uniref:Blue (Type 1) copper domain-containing protein n=1 Tax=Natrinema versiforme JCM 10478 TaxID=1227496 RepID=L9Y9V0_9EURY|nr:plastocyanin/azurin family copper-binding protein [Natrinema versiforme]ELY70411.1 blue (type 1) copper domain-containing protein [Natrinema versiforme JCM 10478]
MSNEHDSRENLSRRGVLKGTAALTGIAALTGEAGAYRDAFDFSMPVAQSDGAARTLTLVGIVGGWLGVAPHEIDGQSNPPLRLIEGEEHEVIWINGDGSMHNFNITAGSAVADDIEVLEATDTVTEQGEYTSVRFTATEEMEEYFCMPHPAQMRGPIELIDPGDVHELAVTVEDESGEPLGAEVYVGDMHSYSDLAARPDPFAEEGQSEESEAQSPGNESAGNATDGNASDGGDGDVEGQQTQPPAIARFDLLENGEYDIEVWTYGHERVSETVTIDGEDRQLTVTLPEIEPGEPAETFSMRLEDGQWVGVAPDAIADQPNPTLDLEVGESYAIEWENTIGRLEPEGKNRHYEPLPGHNLAIASGGETIDWNTFVRSDFTAEEGATQTVEFVANEEMAVYLDQSQLDAIGEISVSGGGETPAAADAPAGANGNATVEAGGNETIDADGNETTAVDGNETDDGV